MAEYSRMASGTVLSAGGNTNVILPFTPTFIEIYNPTRAAAASGVTRASWLYNMGQGAAMVTTTAAGPADGTSYVSAATGTGFKTFQGGLSLQYGPTVFLGASGGITKASPAVVTTTAAHGLVSGDVIVFQNLYQSTTTGMPQICGIPFVVTVTGSTTFTIPWNTNQSNYTAIATGGLNTLASFKKILYPSLYVPGTNVIGALTLSSTTTVVTTAPHNFVVGQQVAFHIPATYGTVELNEGSSTLIPGSSVTGFVTSVTNSTTFVVNINSTGYTAFATNQTVAQVKAGLTFPQVVAVGDNNSGSGLFGATPPSVFMGGSTTATSTINSLAIGGAYINATMQGFIIGSAVAGTAADTIQWRAYLHDINI